jgi:hypothetical protein
MERGTFRRRIGEHELVRRGRLAATAPRHDVKGKFRHATAQVRLLTACGVRAAGLTTLKRAAIFLECLLRRLKTICRSNASFGMKISSLSSLKKDGCNWEGIAQHDQVQMVQRLREA